MPLCYGVELLMQSKQEIFRLGVEKISISSAAINNPSIIPEIAESVGTKVLLLF